MISEPLVPRIVAIHVGQPVRVVHGGSLVPTSIYKRPVAGPVSVDELGLEGDSQSDLRVHGGRDKAICVYAMENYRWWQEHGHLPVAPGLFGENLTVDGPGLTDDAVYVGEYYRLGRDLLVQVTGPREPCFKLGIRVNDPSFPVRFRQTGRLGFYFRVLEPGVINVSDPLQLVERPAGAVSLNLAHRAYLGEITQRDVFEAVLAAPGLGARFRELIRQRATHERAAEIR